MMPRRRSVVLVALTAALAAGCARPGQPGGNVSQDPGASAPGNPASAPAGPSAGGTPTPTGKPVPAEMLLTGTVEEGVESGCLLLAAGGTEYLLLGGDRTVIRPGAAVEVRGRPAPGTVTTCMQGTPFLVSSASRK
jgi:hypothetical protein